MDLHIFEIKNKIYAYDKDTNNNYLFENNQFIELNIQNLTNEEQLLLENKLKGVKR